jgi:hypothetical protein
MLESYHKTLIRLRFSAGNTKGEAMRRPLFKKRKERAPQSGKISQKRASLLE